MLSAEIEKKDQEYQQVLDKKDQLEDENKQLKMLIEHMRKNVR
jgi:hypothetical protein